MLSERERSLSDWLWLWLRSLLLLLAIDLDPTDDSELVLETVRDEAELEAASLLGGVFLTLGDDDLDLSDGEADLDSDSVPENSDFD